MEKYYRIHDIITFKIINDDGPLDNLLGFLLGSWDIELQGFKSSSCNNPDLVILMGRFTPDNQNCIILDDNYYLRDDYFYCQDRYGCAEWQLEIAGFQQENTIARIHSNLLGKTLIPETIINHLIWFKLNEKGYPITHASGISKDGKVYVFAGQGASGKSTIALNLVERGFQLLSDHFILLNKGAALSFPTPFHMTDYNLAPVIRDNMSRTHKVSFRLKHLFHRLTGRRIATKILPRDILESSLVDRAKLRAIFLLLPREKFEAREIDKEELIGHLVQNQRLETFPFTKYMWLYSYLFPQSTMATYWHRYEENLRQALSSVGAFYRVEVPLKYDAETLERINELVCKC
jgi:hypothetical protein